jgi:hypothetical protein
MLHSLQFRESDECGEYVNFDDVSVLSGGAGEISDLLGVELNGRLQCACHQSRPLPVSLSFDPPIDPPVGVELKKINRQLSALG